VVNKAKVGDRVRIESPRKAYDGEGAYKGAEGIVERAPLYEVLVADEERYSIRLLDDGECYDFLGYEFEVIG